jgi:hypothetical protein
MEELEFDSATRRARMWKAASILTVQRGNVCLNEVFEMDQDIKSVDGE